VPEPGPVGRGKGSEKRDRAELPVQGKTHLRTEIDARRIRRHACGIHAERAGQNVVRFGYEARYGGGGGPHLTDGPVGKRYVDPDIGKIHRSDLQVPGLQGCIEAGERRFPGEQQTDSVQANRIGVHDPRQQGKRVESGLTEIKMCFVSVGILKGQTPQRQIRSLTQRREGGGIHREGVSEELRGPGKPEFFQSERRKRQANESGGKRRPEDKADDPPEGPLPHLFLPVRKTLNDSKQGIICIGKRENANQKPEKGRFFTGKTSRTDCFSHREAVYYP